MSAALDEARLEAQKRRMIRAGVDSLLVHRREHGGNDFLELDHEASEETFTAVQLAERRVRQLEIEEGQ